ncbi:MAG: prepilin-type N-terminal cleavage/methylation domain-containing protein [Oscillospiraceae bacterium]|nr:prepilin-type N-terminal cleavage/methylation domain-containing protein [Oscillospiraceae bacterium]
MKKIQQLKSKKGFSLVELLIVIAILAVLVGIIAPQYVRYVERSRQSADIQVVNSIANAITTTAMDPMYEDLIPASGSSIIVQWSNTSGLITVTINNLNDAAADDLAKSITDIVGTQVTQRSNLAKTLPTYVAYRVSDTGGTITYAGHAVPPSATPSTVRESWDYACRSIRG